MDAQRKRPEIQPQSPELESDASPSRGLVPEHRIGLAYTPKPELSGARREENARPAKKFPFALVALAAVIAVGAFFAGTRIAPPPAPPVPISQAHDQKIIVGQADLENGSGKESDQGAPDARRTRTAVYRVFVYAPGAPAGAVVHATVDGAQAVTVPLASGGTVLVPLAQGEHKSLKLRVESPSMVVLHAKTSTGSDVTGALGGGDSVSWEVELP